MTHNNTTKGNDMNRFDTQLHAEDTSAYSDYVDAQELATIEAEAATDVWDGYDELMMNDEYDEGEYDEYDDALSHVNTSFDDLCDMQSRYDDERDLDFYDS